MKPELRVFIGKPGAGKTTLITAAFPNQRILDILPFHKEFWLPGGNIQEEKLILAYQKMYQHLKSIEPCDTILELGTNYPEFNISALDNLQKDYQITIYLCVASEPTCWQRARQRGLEHSMEAFNVRMARDFPRSHEQLLAGTSLNYTTLDMEQPLEATVAAIT